MNPIERHWLKERGRRTMARPILLAVDDDVNVLQAVVEDLRRHYAEHYKVVRAVGGQAGLDTLSELQQRGEAVALILSDQRMPGLCGVDFLERTRVLYPEARRVLLTAHAETEVAIRAINDAKIHYYLSKPWDPPEEKLYPVLDDLLGDWLTGYCPPYEGLRVVGHRWSARNHQLRNFLARNHVPYRWMDASENAEAQKLLLERGLGVEALPLALFPDGGEMAAATPEAMAERVGLHTQAVEQFYDLVVVGGGPAGLAAAVYGASEGLKTLIVEPLAPGGQAGSTSRIENYLGFPSGVTGAELGRRAQTQATRFGAEFLTQRAVGLRTESRYKFVQLADGREVSAHAVLLSMGVQYRRLNVPGAERLTGRGIYYGAALVEAHACQGEEVFIVGGANSAGQAAIHFARFACKVRMLVRGEGLSATMSQYLIDEIGRTPNIVLEPLTEVVEVFGAERLERIRLRSPEGEQETLASALFIFIGAEPGTGWLPESIRRDELGYIVAGPDLKADGRLPAQWSEPREPYLLETSLPGVFVAGDARHGSMKRVAAAVGEGSIAVSFVHRYLACC